VNYTRPGAASVYSSVSWNTPIHIVTYYRYLRFYPDGSVVSLLTTTEPTDVVPHISKENMNTARASSHQNQNHSYHKSDTTPAPTNTPNPIPPVAMSTLKHALRGRWHLTPPSPISKPTDNSSLQTERDEAPPSLKQDPNSAPDPRDLVIETEGVDPKYIYRLYLSLRSSNPSRHANSTVTTLNSAETTRLIWKRFWNYNKLTDDWGEFGLRNYRAYVFRRVRGWGLD